EGPVLLGFEIRVGDNPKAADAEGLLQARLLDAGTVSEAQPRSGKEIAAPKGNQAGGQSRHGFVPKAFIVLQPQATNESDVSPDEHLLPVSGMIASQPVAERQREFVADEPVFVLEAVAEGGAPPASGPLLTLRLAACSMDAGEVGKREVEVAECRRDAPRIHYRIEHRPLMVVLKSGEPMLPARRGCQRQLSTGQEVILAGTLVAVGFQQRPPIEVPERLHAHAVIGVPRAKAECRARGDRHPDVSALQGVEVSIVDALAAGVELIAEQVEVEAPARPGQRCKSVGGAERTAGGAKTQLRHGAAASPSPGLYHAGHGVRSIERALGAAHELQPLHFLQRHHAEIECSARIVNCYAVYDDLVVA